MKWLLDLFKQTPYKRALKLAKRCYLLNGVATVIVGPQGSGKTTLARALALKENPKTFILSPTWGQLRNRFGWGTVLSAGAKIVIIDDLPNTLGAYELLKPIIANSTVLAEVRFQGLKEFKAPSVIICAVSVPSEIRDSRRFRVIDLC